jgi:Uma2 family endonuclease
MAQAARVMPTTYEDYLAALEASPVKLEFHGGEIFAMTGGSVVHARLGFNASAALSRTLAGKPCRVFNSELRISVAGDACYPDASVICGPVQVDWRDRNAVCNPVVIVEVLSPSTEQYDRGDKFELYRRIASLRDYLLVSQDRNQIEHFARNDDGSWLYRACVDGDTLQLSGCSGAISVSEVFADVAELRELAQAAPGA